MPKICIINRWMLLPCSSKPRKTSFELQVGHNATTQHSLNFDLHSHSLTRTQTHCRHWVQHQQYSSVCSWWVRPCWDHHNMVKLRPCGTAQSSSPQRSNRNKVRRSKPLSLLGLRHTIDRRGSPAGREAAACVAAHHTLLGPPLALLPFTPLLLLGGAPG